MGAFGKIRASFFWHVLFLGKQFCSSLEPSVLFLSVWGLVLREVCSRLNPRVRFSGDFIGEKGDGAYLSLISLWISAAISLLALAMFARPVSEFVVDSFVSCVL